MRWLRMVKAVKTGGSWGFLSVLVFTSCVKAIQSDAIKMKSMAVVGFGIDGWLVKNVWTQRQSERQEVSQSMCLSAVLFIKHPAFLHCKRILSEVSSPICLQTSAYSFSKSSKQFEGWLCYLIKMICLQRWYLSSSPLTLWMRRTCQASSLDCPLWLLQRPWSA